MTSPIIRPRVFYLTKKNLFSLNYTLILSFSQTPKAKNSSVNSCLNIAATHEIWLCNSGHPYMNLIQ